MKTLNKKTPQEIIFHNEIGHLEDVDYLEFINKTNRPSKILITSTPRLKNSLRLPKGCKGE